MKASQLNRLTKADRAVKEAFNLEAIPELRRDEWFITRAKLQDIAMENLEKLKQELGIAS